MPLTLLFIRHGETEDNLTKTLQGFRDTSLTDNGHAQARVLATRLLEQYPNPSIIYHSPLIRIKQTIAPILEQRPNVPTVADPDLRGQCLGKLEGGSYDLVDMSNPRSADGGEGVERFDAFVGRLRRALGRIVGKEVKELKGRGDRSEDRVVVIATHGVGITSLFYMLDGTLQPAEGSEEARNGGWGAVGKRGPEAYPVRWTDSDDVAKVVVESPDQLPVGQDGSLAWDKIQGQPFEIVVWGKKEKAL